MNYITEIDQLGYIMSDPTLDAIPKMPIANSANK